MPGRLWCLRNRARGRGAGGDPTKGEAAALESELALRRITNDTQLAIITAGMGGGSGTGAAGQIARLAKQQGAMTIAVVTYPFNSEGALRKQNAEWGLERLREHCDTILVIPNERLLEIEGVKDLPIGDAFRVGDELLVRSITGVAEMLTTDGMVNLDFEDLKSVIQFGSGVAMIGLGEASVINATINSNNFSLIYIFRNIKCQSNTICTHYSFWYLQGQNKPFKKLNCHQLSILFL